MCGTCPNTLFHPAVTPDAVVFAHRVTNIEHCNCCTCAIVRRACLLKERFFRVSGNAFEVVRPLVRPSGLLSLRIPSLSHPCLPAMSPKTRSACKPLLSLKVSMCRAHQTFNVVPAGASQIQPSALGRPFKGWLFARHDKKTKAQYRNPEHQQRAAKETVESLPSSRSLCLCTVPRQIDFQASQAPQTLSACQALALDQGMHGQCGSLGPAQHRTDRARTALRCGSAEALQILGVRLGHDRGCTLRIQEMIERDSREPPVGV